MMKNKNPFLIILTIIILNAVIANTVVSASSSTRVYIDNPNLPGVQSAFIAQPGETFTINIEVAEVADLFAWEARLSWNATILNATSVTEGPFLQSQPEETFFIRSIKNEFGYVDMTSSTVGDYPGVTGDGSLVSITFLVKGLGQTDLDISLVTLLDHYRNYIIPWHSYDSPTDGIFSNVGLPDIALTNISINPTAVQAGELVFINVTAANQWVETATFNVTVSYDETVIETKTDITLDGETSTILEFVWNTTGVLGGDYTITAEATTVQGEADTTDNTLTGGPVRIPEHDVAITDVTANPTTVTAGQTVSISVIVKNKGDFSETFKVTLYSDSNNLKEWTLTLAPDASETLTFSWDTTNVAPTSYQLKAVAETVSGERSTTDNTFVTPWERSVEITSPTQTSIPMTLLAGVAGVAVVAVVAALFFVRRRGSNKPA